MGNLTVPNLLSLLRIASVPFLVVSMTQGRFDFALALFVAAGLTDFADGWIARRFGQVTALGALLDPAGDKLLLNAIFVSLAVPALPASVHFPVWLAVLVLSRDVLIVSISMILFVGEGQKRFTPSFTGKLATFIVILAAGGALLVNVVALPAWVADLITVVTATLTVASGFHYIAIVSGLLPRPSERVEGE